MTVHPLSALLAPASVAIFGASNDPTRISGRSLRYFREAGYQGGLYPINPTRDTVQGLTAYPDIVARSIAVAKGAVIDGTVTVTSGQPVVEFEEKRAAR